VRRARARVVPDRRPPMVRSGSFSRGVDPLQSLHVLPAVRRVRRTGSLEVLRPFDDVTPTSPVARAIASRRPPEQRRCVQPRRGSARRLSRPLSGFLAGPGFAALFRAAAVPGVLPAELSSSPGSRPLSRSLAPMRILDRRVEGAMRATDPPGFTDARALARWPGSPPELGRRFHRWRANGFLDALDHAHRTRPVSGGFVRFEAFIPPRSRGARRDGLPPRCGPLLPWAFAPPEPCSGRASVPS
jgi:hypothetical protein